MEKKKQTIARRLVIFLLIGAILNLSVGCRYFEVTTYDKTQASVGLQEIEPDDYIIVHFGTDTFHLNKLLVDLDKQEISGYKVPVGVGHGYFDNPKPKGNKYKRKYQSPDNEVHVYINGSKEAEDGLMLITISEIERLDVYDHQVGATVASYVLGGIGITTLAIGVLMLVILLTKSSCPFVYILDGEEYVFYGETFGGAISQNIERDDYMPLPGFSAQDGIYSLKITNELKELQYTDIAELFCIEHNSDVKVLMDSYGKPYSLKNVSAPIRAVSDNGSDYTKLVSALDSTSYLFTDEISSNEDFSSINLSFENKKITDEAKLVLTIKNTLWLDYIFERFFAQFGDKYNDFAKKQKNKSREEKMKWIKEQGVLLTVEVKTSKGWKSIEDINMVGPLASRSIVVPIDLTGIEEQVLEVRLSSGYHFWELDYAGIDFSKNIPLEMKPLVLEDAKDENAVDLKASLTATDGNYLEQLYIGAQAYLKYRAPEPKEKLQQSLFFHTRGYYEYVRTYTGKPNVAELKKFRNPGSFAHFSKQRLTELAKLEK